LSIRANQQVQERKGGKTIKESDVIQAIYANDILHFLKLDFPRKAKENKPPSKRLVPNQQTHIPTNKVKLSKPKPVVSVVSDDKAITRFFGGKPVAKQLNSEERTRYDVDGCILRLVEEDEIPLNEEIEEVFEDFIDEKLLT
jgi:hypothetical protein